MEHKSYPTPHVLIFPVPLQGHLTPMLNLAEILCLANLKVTFLNTTYNQKRLAKHTDIEARFGRYPGFTFKTVPDGLPDDHPRSGDKTWFREMHAALASSVKPLLKDNFVGKDEVTCLILDGWMSYANDVDNEVKLPVITFITTGANFIWTFQCLPKMIAAGELPFKDEDMDELVKNAPGMDSFLRYRDLPCFFRDKDISVFGKLQDQFNGEIQKIKQAHTFILNTFEDLEGPILSLIREHWRGVYTIGPLHAHLKYRLNPKDTTLSNTSSSDLWEVDRSCISWLDQKPEKSVVYASFGTITTFTKDQLMEFWAGLVQSKKYFLWVIKSDNITGSGSESPAHDDLVQGTKERGYIVSWAPQEEVLAHRAVGGFFTHSGRGSVLESIVAGVPMLCWPYFSDHLVDSRFISEVWKIGLDMKDTCDRKIVENMINDLMERKKDELRTSVSKLSHLAKKSISEGGSSYSNLDQLIEEIKGMTKKGEH
ncbi:7-deoxyloganetic acid glucosyltransferase-like [Chenopodium quinoa]|uniref:7-deoxyloganetic acid glucosyltransferase-like n=1 Tax=Chenopodium quinoa TaxID=63459 RepID=UPI000B7809F8|nr:7-deoxyloganetic acid glucosyltransferase-like [Chenopodium quinoa]